MKIAIVGTGIAGNVAAYRLASEHEIVVYEVDERVGGHTNTVDVARGGRHYSIDTGFIVFNDWTYPNFIALLEELGVESQVSDMSFSVRDDRTGLEYNGTSISSLFAQRRNLLRPSFYRMLADILRFNREATELLDPDYPELTLEAYLQARAYSSEFVERYIVPMGAAIWSSDPGQLRRMPAKFFVRFFDNHGLLSIDDRPTWRVIRGGSRRYLDRLVAGHRDRIRLGTPVERVLRLTSGVELRARGCEPERFDAVFLACHSDQALRMLGDPSMKEREILSAIGFQRNDVVLHTDQSLMPRRRRAWAAWNYRIPSQDKERVAVTYNMNILQGLDAPEQFCVTLNDSDAVASEKIIAQFSYDHPVFTPEAVAAQQRLPEINGTNSSYYCGAYWRYGFHEDGVVSALEALKRFEENLRDAQRHLRRAS